MTTAQNNAALLPLCTQALQQDQSDAVSGYSLFQESPPVRICPRHSSRGQFKLQLALHRNREGEVATAERTLSVLDKLIGPLVGQRLQVEILEQSYGQYAQFALEMDTRQGLYRVMKTMNGQTWALCQAPTLTEVLAFVQTCVYQADDEGSRISGR